MGGKLRFGDRLGCGVEGAEREKRVRSKVTLLGPGQMAEFVTEFRPEFRQVPEFWSEFRSEIIWKNSYFLPEFRSEFREVV